jgi:hypothetical protein
MVIETQDFRDETGYLSFKNLYCVFRQLIEELTLNRETLGNDRYQTLLRLTEKMRGYFEADPTDLTGDTLKGCKIVHEMEDIIREVRRKP